MATVPSRPRASLGAGDGESDMDRAAELQAHWAAQDLPEVSAFADAPGRLYVAIVFTQWMAADWVQTCTFDDAQDAAAFIRFCLMPGLAFYSPNPNDDMRAYAIQQYGEDSEELRHFDDLTALAERAAEGPKEVAAELIDEIIQRFNDLYHGFPELEGFGSLAAVLSKGKLREWLDEELDADPEDADEDDFPHAALARLVATGAFDESDSRHLQLADDYLSVLPTERPGGGG